MIKISDEAKENIIKDYNNYIDITVICDKYNIKSGTLRLRLKEWGIPTRQRMIKPYISYQEVKEYIEVISNSNCKLLTPEEDYISTRQKLKIICGICNEEFENSFSDFKDRKNKMCYKCHKDKMGEKYKLSLEYVISILNEEGYEYISGEYKNNKSKLMVKCSSGHVTPIIVTKFLNSGHRCIICNGGINYTYEQVKAKIEQFVGYKLLTDSYNNYLTNLDVLCPVGHVFTTYLSKWDSGARCHICNSSKNEKLIMSLLESNNVSYIKEYKLDDCKDIRKLPFDFAIFNDKNKKDLKCIIEFDGEHHFYPRHGDTYRFDMIQRHDKIKNKFCENYNISLIRIPYYELKNIESILHLHNII